jgi:hypothetical protein
MPIVQSINVYRGEDITLNFTMTPKVDITGWTISLTVAKAFDMNSKVFQVTAGITNGPNGNFSVILPSALLNINPDKYAYDVFRTSPGNARILSVGNFIISADARNP